MILIEFKITLTLSDLLSFISIAISFNKLINCFYSYISFALSPYRHFVFIHFFFSYHQHIRHFHQFSITDLLAYLFIPVINLCTNICIFQLICKTVFA